MPPPTYFQEPVKAGIHVTALMVWPPPWCLSSATPILIPTGWFIAISVDNFSMSSILIPVISDAHFAFLSLTCSLSSSNPFV